MVMTTKIRKWGNSYAVRIPKNQVAGLGLRDGSAVEIRIKPARKKYSLDELIAQITPENRYAEINWGPDIGKEILEEWKK